MSARGIPPSPDRFTPTQRVILTAAAALTLVGLFGIVVYLGGAPLSHKGVEVFQRHMGPSGNADESDRSEAFVAAQQYVLGKIYRPDIEEVQWTGTAHEGRRGYYKFNGVVVARAEEITRRFKYVVVVSTEPGPGWFLQDIRIEIME